MSTASVNRASNDWVSGGASALAVIHAAVERGVTLFDTAEVYGPLTNEELGLARRARPL